MPAKILFHIEQTPDALAALGELIRLRRKALGVNASITAQSAGLSRVTLHRIEKGEPSVTMGAWANVLAVLGLRFKVEQAESAPVHATPQASDWIPTRIRLAEYPQLKALSWQLQDREAISPVEAQSIYERNARHIDASVLTESERALMQALHIVFAGFSGDFGV